MVDWWGAVGETSVLAGGAFGTIWALISTHRRRNKFLRASLPPVGQLRWFLANLIGMSCYLILVIALALATLHDVIPQALFLFLLGLSALAFSAALMQSTTDAGRPVQHNQMTREPSADPPSLPLRKSA